MKPLKANDQPLYDECGNRIKEGDLLEIFHFRAKRRSKQYMYQIVVIEDGYFKAKDYSKEKSHYALAVVADDKGILKGCRVLARNLSRKEDFYETLRKTKQP